MSKANQLGTAKVVVMNYSGNVGKSTLSRHLLKPRLDGELVYVETINAIGEEAEALGAKNLHDVMVQVLVEDKVIVDVGSSNIEELLRRAQAMSGVLQEFDTFVLPVTPATKTQQDTVKLISYLVYEADVDPSRIVVIQNLAKPDEAIQEQFAHLLEAIQPYTGADGEQVIRCITVPEHEGFKLLGEPDALQHLDEAALKEALVAAKGADKRVMATAVLRRKVVKNLSDTLDAQYIKAFGPIAAAAQG